MFQVAKDEAQNLISQTATSDLKSQNVISSWGGNRKLPYAFTENGVAMLSSVLRSKTAIEVNIQKHLSDTDRKIDEVLTRLDEKESEPIEGFFFEGQIFDAYSLISDLIRKATRRIVLIDNYVDDRILKVLTKRKEGVSAIIYTDPRHSQISNDLRRHNAQYPRIEVRHCTNVHDRFLIIDDTVYLIGGSIKDLGKKIVAFSQMHQNPDNILSNLR